MTAFAPARALLWEYVRVARRPVAMVTGANCALAALYRRALEPLGAQREELVFVALFTTMLITIVLTLLNCRADGSSSGGAQLGFERRLYRLPLSSTLLAFWRLTPAALAAGGMYLTPVLFLVLAFDTRWPVLGPLLVTLVVLVWAQALNWSLGKRPYLLAPVGLPLGMLLFSWLGPRLRPRGGDLLTHWQDFGLADVGLLVVILVTGVGVAMIGVHFDRSQPPGTRTLGSLLRRSTSRHGSERAQRPTGLSRDDSDERLAPAFPSPVRAQLWMEWREKGRLLPIFGFTGLAINALIVSFPDFETGPMLRAAFGFLGLLFLVGPPVAGLLHGRFDLSSAVPTLDRLRATRPLGDRQLAWTLLLASLRSALAAWATTAAGLSLLGGALFLWGDREHVIKVAEGLRQALLHAKPIDLALLLVLLLAWAAAGSGLMASLVLSGRNWIIGLFAMAPTVLVVFALMAERIADFDSWRRLLPVAALLVVTVLPLATALCAWLAWRRGYLTGTALLVAGGVWAALSLALALRFPTLRAALASGELPLERTLAWAAPAALSGVVLPLALAPLMLSWNRHR